MAATQPDDRNADGNTNKKLINLLRGWPSPHLLPAESLRAAANRVLSDRDVFVPALQYGPDPGYQPLREALAAWLMAAYHGSGGSNGDAAVPNPAPDPDRICITGGASQSIACIMQSFTDPAYTRAVWAAAPCYHLVCPIFEDSGFAGRLRAAKEDDGGIDVAWLEARLREEEERAERAGEMVSAPVYKTPSPYRKAYRHVIYVVPTCANPSGTTMSVRRRRDLIGLARRYDALVIADDVYDFLRWRVDSGSSPATTGEEAALAPPPRLSDIDRQLGASAHDPPGAVFGHAVSNGSFSKLVGPGVRTGWVEGTRAFAHGLAQTGSTRSGGAPSQLTAAVVCEMLRAGRVDEHVAGSARPALQRRHGMAAAAVERYLGPFGVQEKSRRGGEEKEEQEGGVYGGYFLWLTLREDGPLASEVAARARVEENLIVAAGEMFEVRGDEDGARFPRNIRLCYSWEEEDDIVEGIRRLGRVLQRLEEGGRESWGHFSSGGLGNFK